MTIATMGQAAERAASAGERRGCERLGALRPATVVCEDGARFHCVVRAMSLTGAKIGIARQHRLPDRFRLVVSGYPLGYPMQRAWQRGEFAGLTLILKDASSASATRAI